MESHQSRAKRRIAFKKNLFLNCNQSIKISFLEKVIKFSFFIAFNKNSSLTMFFSSSICQQFWKGSILINKKVVYLR